MRPVPLLRDRLRRAEQPPGRSRELRWHGELQRARYGPAGRLLTHRAACRRVAARGLPRRMSLADGARSILSMCSRPASSPEQTQLRASTGATSGTGGRPSSRQQTLPCALAHPRQLWEHVHARAARPSRALAGPGQRQAHPGQQLASVRGASRCRPRGAGRPHDAANCTTTTCAAKAFHRGNGWFRDGERADEPGFDYYNAWGFHYQLQWIRRIAPDLDRTLHRPRLQ